MKITSTTIPDVKLIQMSRFNDPRGFFSETYSRTALKNDGIDIEFVQDNLSLSKLAGTVRGLHFQHPPAAQAKLVWVSQGRILDVAVDLRTGSPTRGLWVGVELSAEAWNQLYVPVGFAHGFCTLEPDTIVQYKVSSPYAPAHDSGLLWNDPDLKIDWPVSDPVLSDKDRQLPCWKDLGNVFPA